jgi:hypothetical protein
MVVFSRKQANCNGQRCILRDIIEPAALAHGGLTIQARIVIDERPNSHHDAIV